MDAPGIDELLSTSDGEAVEVLIGLQHDAQQSKLEAYMGDDGIVLKDLGFDIYRVRVTLALLEQFLVGEPAWIEYIENPGSGSVTLFDMDSRYL